MAVAVHSFAEIRQSILETAKSLVDNTKALVNSAASSQEALAEAARKAVKTISREVDFAKLGAAALGSDDIEGQVRREGGREKGADRDMMISVPLFSCCC